MPDNSPGMKIMWEIDNGQKRLRKNLQPKERVLKKQEVNKDEERIQHYALRALG
jgi:hypothetical protein